MIASILKGCEGVAVVISAVLVLVLMDCRQETKWSESLFLNSVVFETWKLLSAVLFLSLVVND